MRSRKLIIECLEDRRVLSADFNGNGTIDAPDLANWKTGFGTVGTATKPQGDYDVDRDVDGVDFLAWQRTLGQTVPSGTFIDISIDELNEANETAPGAIVFRNSDFSKQSLAVNQPEAGLPLYVPDYSAPASVYDPNAGADFTSATVDIGAAMVGQYTMRFTYDTTKIQLWTSFNWAGFQAVGGRFKIPSGVIVTPATQAMSFQIEGIQNSTTFSTDSILVEAIPNAGGANLTDTGEYTVIETNAGVDGNRDTAIDFASSHDRQLLFWLNNDEEGFHDTDTTVETEEIDITTPDNTNSVIDQRRDLEDLAPLRVNVAPLLVNNAFDTAGGGTPAPGQIEVTYRLNLIDAAGSALRLFYSNNTNADVTRHVSNETVAGVQASDPFFRTAAGPNFTTQQQLEQIIGGSNSFLFEALGSGYGSAFAAAPILEFETLIEYPDGSTSSKVHRIELDLRDIKSFYTRWSIQYDLPSGDLRTDVSFQHYATPAAPLRQSQVQNEPFVSGNDTTVLVHGWNMPDDVNNDWKAAFAETMFKRLYWQGYRGEFVSFDWPTFSDEEGPDWPIFGTGANITYNPSDFQAYRSAQALRNILENYRGDSPNLQPVHLLAHSMGNIVAGEALRQYTFDPVTVDPLVTNYVAMEAAVSAGAYRDNGTDSQIVGRPIPDLYRFWQHGRDGLSDPSLGNTEYFQSISFASENRLKYYNEQDFALNLWDINNAGKEFLVQSTVWPYDYEFEFGDGENINNDIFTRVPDVGAEVILDLALPNGRPGANAYEILAFYAQSASLALGTKPVTAFDGNFNIEALGMLGGSDIRANHSYQFMHDAAETWDFYTQLKADLGFNATYSLPAIVGTVVASLPANMDTISATTDETSREPLNWFLEPISLPTRTERETRRLSTLVPESTGSRPTSLRPAILDAYYEMASDDLRSTIGQESPSQELPDSLDIVFESLERLQT